MITEAKSVAKRLETLSILVRIIWTVAGIGGGTSFGFWLAQVVDNQIVILGTLLLGGALGYFIGHLSTVFIDWAREMLLLQFAIAEKNLAEKTAPKS
jgi:hypothetical protein